METLKEELVQVLFEEISEINGDSTEEELNMDITRMIVEERLKTFNFVEKLRTETDDRAAKPYGVWVYAANSVDNLVLDMFTTVAEAVKAAVRLIDAKIVCEGKLLTYDALNDNEAYYIDGDIVRLVEL